MHLEIMEEQNKSYICPMHPEVAQEKPGLCSKCGMNLVVGEEKEKHKGHSHEEATHKDTSWTKFLPLVIIFAVILLFVGIRLVWLGSFDLMVAMQNFMAGFFLVFGFFKVINLKGFADAYQMYDLVAKRSRFYAFLYPFLELALGLAYLLSFQLLYISIVTLVVMGVSAVGVGMELKKKNHIVCACLGAVFKIPMTKVTFLEDVLMFLMALWMIFLLST